MESYYFLCAKKTIEQIYEKQVSVYTQIVRNDLFKCSKYTVLQLTLKLWQKCNFLLLPSNQERSEQLG